MQKTFANVTPKVTRVAEPVDLESTDTDSIPMSTLSGPTTQSDGGSHFSEPDAERQKDLQQYVIVDVASVMPRFERLQTFLRSHIMYPPVERDLGMETDVELSAVVEINGELSNISVTNSDPRFVNFEKEAIRVEKKMPAWKPGKMNGEPVRVRITIPISFKLAQ